MKCSLCHNEVEENQIDTTVVEDYKKYHSERMIEGMVVCKECAEKYWLNEKIEYYSKALETYEKVCNSTLYNYDNLEVKAFAQAFARRHRYLQGEMINFLIKVAKELGSHAGDCAWTDARNEHHFQALKEMTKNF